MDRLELNRKSGIFELEICRENSSDMKIDNRG